MATSGREALTADPELAQLLRQVAAVSLPLGGAAVVPPFPAGAQLGPYRLLEIAGAGGMGIVYRAHDSRLARDVALKLLPKDAAVDEAARRRLLEEARAAAALSHPNLASVYEAGELDGHSFFAMELVRGTPLRQSPAPLEQRRAWAVEIARGLAAMHRAGWIHRDVKPDNVMVTADGVAKLLDLGLATKARGAPEPMIAGTPGYMSPEQQRGDPLDARSDVYSFGRLLLELLPELARHEVVRRCLAADPAARYASAAELVAALERRPRRAWAWLAATAGLVALGAALVLRGAPGKTAPHAPRRLTGRGVDRPLSDSAISSDGRQFAFVDDDGLTVAELAAPERAKPVPLEERALALEPRPGRDGFAVISAAAGGGKAIWVVDGAGSRRVYRGTFKHASLSSGGDRVVAIEGARVVVRSVSDGAELAAVTFGSERALHGVRWSPDARHFALSASDRTSGEPLRTLEIWPATLGAPVKTVRTQRLAQAYVPVVFAWAASGELLYALADAPGEGSGSAVWLLPLDAEPRLLAPVEGQFVASLGLGAGGQLLTSREDAHLRIHLADVSAEGSLGNARQLTHGEYDERPTGWESSAALLVMSTRDLVPHLARRELARADSEWLEGRGWAQTWPTPTGAEGEWLYWWAERPARDEGASAWSLALRQRGRELGVQTPAPVSGHVSTISEPPHGQRVRCAPKARVCVLAVLEGAALSFFGLSLDGGAPEPWFRARATASGGQIWAISADGLHVALAEASEAGPRLRVLDRQGHEERVREVPELVELRSVAFAAAEGGFYVCGMRADSQQLVGYLPAKGPLEASSSSPSSFGELHLSPDGRHLAWVEKDYNPDLWLTQLE